MKIRLLPIIIIITVLTACKNAGNQKMSDVEVWQLGWRMIASSMDENFELTSLQFDSLRNSTEIMDSKYLVTGLEAKKKLGKNKELIDILSSQPIEVVKEMCLKQSLINLEICKEYSIEKVDNKKLQYELIRMYINDQYARSNLMTDLLLKYNLSKNEVIIDSFGVITDERNRERLKEIIKEFGFPTKKLVGRDAMDGIFFIIQHADGDIEWQKSQLPNIERAVKQQDLVGERYAYLYDRIQINNGGKQLYGTQFSNVDPIKKIVQLAEVEDIENLDKRRREVGLMPIEMYKEFMLKNL